MDSEINRLSFVNSNLVLDGSLSSFQVAGKVADLVISKS